MATVSYAASLLIYYDADTSADGYETNVDESTTDFVTDTEEARLRKKARKREIDSRLRIFANSVIAADLTKDKPCPPRFPTSPDPGFLKGLSSLRYYFVKIQRDIRAKLDLIPGGVSSGSLQMELDIQDSGELSE